MPILKIGCLVGWVEPSIEGVVMQDGDNEAAYDLQRGGQGDDLWQNSHKKLHSKRITRKPKFMAYPQFPNRNGTSDPG